MNYCYPKHTHFVLWGSETLDAQRAFLQLSNYYEIDSFITNKDNVGNVAWNNISYLNIEEYLNKLRNRSQKIIITLRRSEPWKQHVDYLLKKGLKFFDDFNLYFLLESDFVDIDVISRIVASESEGASIVLKFSGNKKLYFINGNCQTGLLEKYLSANKEFVANYIYMELPRICSISASSEKLYDIALRCADLCISQPISSNNRFSAKLSTLYIKEHLQQNAKLIIIPKLHFTGYFPQFKKAQDSAVVLGRAPVFAYGDKFIDELFAQGKSYEEIKDVILSPDFLSSEEFNKYFDEQLAQYKKEEDDCDVKLYDYIKKNCRKSILWYSFNHPVNAVIKELAVRTLMCIGLKRGNAETFADCSTIDGSEGLRGQMQLVYPAVYKALGIVSDDRRYSINVNSSNIRIYQEDYIRVYCNSYKTDIPIIDIWGSCVSRELFNFTNKIKAGSYILQNPVHTFLQKPAAIDESQIFGSSNFTKRMAVLEFRKKVQDYFNENFKSKYLMIDTCDCRNDVYVMRAEDGSDTYICDSISAEKTINAQADKDNIVKKSVFSLSEEYWEECVKKFVEVIKSKYDEENIIINEFRFADRYVDEEGKLCDFKYQELYRKRYEVTRKIELKLEQLLPKAKVLPALEDPLGYALHKIGCSPMHYVDEYYYIQNMKLQKLLKISSPDDREIAELQTAMHDTYNY